MPPVVIRDAGVAWRHNTLPSPIPYVTHRHTSLKPPPPFRPSPLRVWLHLWTSPNSPAHSPIVLKFGRLVHYEIPKSGQFSEKSPLSLKSKMADSGWKCKSKFGLRAPFALLQLCFQNEARYVTLKTAELFAPMHECPMPSPNSVSFPLVLLQSTYSQLLPTPEGPEPDTDSSSAVRTHTVKPSSQVQSASATHYLSMSASYRRTASRLDWTLSSWCEWLRPCF